MRPFLSLASALSALAGGRRRAAVAEVRPSSWWRARGSTARSAFNKDGSFRRLPSVHRLQVDSARSRAGGRSTSPSRNVDGNSGAGLRPPCRFPRVAEQMPLLALSRVAGGAAVQVLLGDAHRSPAEHPGRPTRSARRGRARKWQGDGCSRRSCRRSASRSTSKTRRHPSSPTAVPAALGRRTTTTCRRHRRRGLDIGCGGPR